MRRFQSFLACLIVITNPLEAAKEEDLSASLPETNWFHAELHVQELDNFMSAWTGPQDLTCLDVFGYSGSIAKCWRREGFNSEQYDIGLNRRSHDLLGKRGFLHLCRLGMRLVAKGIIVAGPPCAMNVFLSSSVHQRHVYGPEGNQQNAKVRMSNRLVKNFCVWLELLARHRKFWFVIEQPTSSWLFKMQAMVSIMAAMACVKVTTWMGFFSHDLPKPTHLVGTLPDLGHMKRRMSKADRARIAARLERRQASRKAPRTYYVRGDKKGQRKTVQGGKHLSLTANYTPAFALAVFKIWVAAFQDDV